MTAALPETRMPPIPWLDPEDPAAFPDPETALRDPDGLLAAGGELSPERLLAAYRLGIFPWFGDGQPILWWSPDPRAVLEPGALKISRSLAKTLRNGRFEVALDTDFDAVIAACAEPREGQDGTWITESMQRAYRELHRLGYAHAVSVHRDGRLVGGLYGLAIGGAFFGESMFSRASDASKVALVHLCRRLEAHGFGLIDCQMMTRHIATLGARFMPRRDFTARIAELVAAGGTAGPWRDGGAHADGS